MGGPGSGYSSYRSILSKTQRQLVLDAVNKGIKTSDQIALELKISVKRVSAVLSYLEKVNAIKCTGVRKSVYVGNPAKEYVARMFHVPE